MIMESHRRAQQLWGRFGLTLKFVCMGGFFAFACHGMNLPGTWVSKEISHPSLFFAETLSNDTQKSLSLFFDRNGTFAWRNREGGCLAGTYLIQKGTLILTNSHGEAIILKFTILGDRLLLRSRDDFTFEFQKTTVENHVSTEPCKA